MCTEKKLEANQLNAQNSTGPRTPEGKAKSALNAIKHGLCAQSVIISSEKSEDFHRFSKNLTAEFDPANQVEKIMVRRIVSLSWRLERAAKYESLVLDKILKAQFEADTQCHPRAGGDPGSISETNPTNVGQASPLGKNNETNPTVAQASVLESNCHPERSEGSNSQTNLSEGKSSVALVEEDKSKTQLSKEDLEFLQDDLMATAVFNDFRDERLLERVRRYESQMARELNNAIDSLYKAQTFRIQRRLDAEAAHKAVAESLQRQVEIDQHRLEIQKHEERFKKMTRHKILNYPDLDNFDEVKLLSVMDPVAFKRKVDIGLKPYDIACDLMEKYNNNPKFYTPQHYAQTEERLCKQYHSVSVKRC
jgi:hypothetical protein